METSNCCQGESAKSEKQDSDCSSQCSNNCKGSMSNELASELGKIIYDQSRSRFGKPVGFA